MRRLTHRRRRGVVLLAVGVCLAMLVAGLGLAVDLSRLLEAQESLSAKAQSAALAAALELDGTAEGVERARDRVGSAGLSGLRLEFAAHSDGPWSEDPLDVAQLRAARATVRSSLPVSLLRTVVSERVVPVGAAARAWQQPVEAAEPGVAMPIAVSAADGRILDGLAVEADPRHLHAAIRSGIRVPVRVGDTLPLYPAQAAAVREVLESAATHAPVWLLPVVDDARKVVEFGAFAVRPMSRLERVAGSYLVGAGHRAVAASGLWRVELVRASQ